MANEERIDDLISPKAFKQLKDLEAGLDSAQAKLIDSIDAAQKFNQALSMSKSAKEFADNQTKAAIAVQKLAQETSKAEIAAIKAAEAKEKASKKATQTIISDSAKEVEAYRKSAQGSGKLGDVVTETGRQQAAAANSATALKSATSELGKETEQASKDEQEFKNELTEVDKIASDYVGTLDQNIKRNIELKLELSSLSDTQKQLKKDFESGSITQQQYTSKSAALEKETLRVKTAIQQNGVVIKQATREQLAASGSAEQQRARLDRLRVAYSALNDEERENAQIGGVIKSELDKLVPSVNKAAEATGKYTDSVGNYGKATEGLPGPINSAVSSVKEFFTLLLTNPIGIVVAALYGMYEAFKLNDTTGTKLKGVFTGLKVAVSNTANAFVDLIGNVKDYISESSAIEEVSELATSAVKRFIDTNVRAFTLGKVTGQQFIDTFKSAVAPLRSAIGAGIDYEDTLDALEYKNNELEVAISATNLAITEQDIIVKDATKSLDERLKALDTQSELEKGITQDRLSLINEEIQGNRLLLSELNKGSTFYEETQFRIFELEKKRNEVLDEQALLEVTIARRRSSFLKEIRAEQQRVADEEAKSLYELNKQRIEQEKEVNKELVDDTTNAYELRIASSEVYFNRQRDLLKLTRDYELRGVKEGSDEQKKILEGYAFDVEQLKKQQAQDELKILESSLNEQEKLLLQSNKDSLLIIETERDNALSRIVGNDEAAAMQRLAIEREYTLKYVALQIEQAEAAIAAQKKAGENTIEAEAQLAALRRKYAEEARKDNAKTSDELKKQLQDAISIGQQVLGTLGDAANAYYDNQLAKIDQAKAASDDRYESEKEAIENSTLDEEKKANKLALLDAQKAERDRQLEEEKRRTQLKQAKLQRAIQIAQIIASTAQAVLAQLSIPVAGFGLAAAAGIIGAIQLAAVLAAPLPAYKDGGKKKGSGPALVGEVGPELYVTPSGEVGMTPGKPTVTWIPDGTQIYSNADTKKMIASRSIYNVTDTATKLNFDVDKLVNSGRQNTRDLEKAFSKKRSSSTVVTERGFNYIIENGSNRTQYLNRNFKRK